MDFGHVASPEGISFAVPAPSLRGPWAAWPPRPQEPYLRLGAPAWSRREWLGRLYPRGSGPGDWLRLYAAQAGAIELNATFYAVPDEATLDSWVAATPPSFRFCPKVPRPISHDLDRGQVGAFVARLRRLGERLGPALLQLPETFAPAGLRALAALLQAFPADFRLVVELRHPGWFAEGVLIEEAAALLAEGGRGAVITDVAGRRDVCHGTLTAPFLLVRWVGHGGHPSDEPRLDGWLARLADWRARGLAEAYLILHQPDDQRAPESLVYAAAAAPRAGLAVPPISLVPPPPQLSLF